MMHITNRSEISVSFRNGNFILWLVVAPLLCLATGDSARTDELPEFQVPNHEREMQTLNELHALHHGAAFTDCTLWDPWLPHATLWTGQQPRDRYRASFLNRRIDLEGYVAMQQHRGMAHSDGWPFPAWQQSTGIGWHFSTLHEPWAIQNFGLKPLTSTEGWQIEGAEELGIDPASGLQLRATGDQVTLTTPVFRCGTIVAPFVRIEWAAQGLAPDSQPRVAWRLQREEAWNAERTVPFPPLGDSQGMRYANVPLYRHPAYAGLVTQYRFTFDCTKGAELTIKSVITAIDTRHPITNSIYLQGCVEYFSWTRDIDFLRQNMGRMRKAINYALGEFSVRQQKHVLVPWVGHNGRSGIVVAESGEKTIRPGLGVGNNYWDLLPFGGHDALATIYLFDAMQKFAALEREIAANSDWQIAADEPPIDPDELETLAEEVRLDFQDRFWDPQKGRFVGWIDVDGKAYDYGFTFLNLEAIYYGLPNQKQADAVFDWLDGGREIPGDTSRGKDIYHWRFAPRATTRRNIETYVWPWSAPESIPWGNQVQDGGAVLGFSYFDLMARLQTLGPDDAARRLQVIADWFREVQDAGGYRPYYAQPGRGTLQGGGTPGGLGLDVEFLESVLVPQVMLYGFLGLRAEPDGFHLNPKLPSDWTSLTITRVHCWDHVLDITVEQAGRVRLKCVKAGQSPLVLYFGSSMKVIEDLKDNSVFELRISNRDIPPSR
jgi:hypothetical protein